jgi:hypothetical protein
MALSYFILELRAGAASQWGLRLGQGRPDGEINQAPGAASVGSFGAQTVIFVKNIVDCAIFYPCFRLYDGAP